MPQDEERGHGMFHMENAGGHEQAIRQGDPAEAHPKEAPKPGTFHGTNPKGEPSGTVQLA